MAGNRYLFITMMLICLAVLVGGGFFVIPAYHRTSQNKARIANLQSKISGLAGQTVAVTQLADEVSVMNERRDLELKGIPEVADMATLMRKLSMPVDGITVRDQTFTAGSPNPATQDEEDTAQAMPLTIDMVGRFDSVYALIQAAESMNRLLRVTSLRMEVEPELENAEVRFITASVSLDAIFEPVNEGEVN